MYKLAETRILDSEFRFGARDGRRQGGKAKVRNIVDRRALEEIDGVTVGRLAVAPIGNVAP
jgi:hypothetical protein